MFFIFAALGMELFGEIGKSGKHYSYRPVALASILHIFLRIKRLDLVCQKTLDHNQTICLPEFQSNENFVTTPRHHDHILLTKLIVFNFSCIQDCTDEVPCEGLNNHAHFKNFGFSMLTLFRVSTGDNWNGILKVFKFALILSLGLNGGD